MTSTSCALSDEEIGESEESKLDAVSLEKIMYHSRKVSRLALDQDMKSGNSKIRELYWCCFGNFLVTSVFTT